MPPRKPPADRIIPQSDTDFVSELPPVIPQSQHPLALQVRRVVAAFAGVMPELVRSDVTFSDLEVGSADSIDELDLILRLEAVLGFELSKAERAQILSPDFTSRLTVVTFARAVCAVAASRAAA